MAYPAWGSKGDPLTSLPGVGGGPCPRILVICGDPRLESSTHLVPCEVRVKKLKQNHPEDTVKAPGQLLGNQGKDPIEREVSEFGFQSCL